MARKYDWKNGCNVEATLSVIGGRWKPVILCNLGEPIRFGALCRAMPNATQRMITLQLRELEADGIIQRTVYAEVPPRVEYELTEFGRSLAPVLDVMSDWGKEFKQRKQTELHEADDAA